VDAALAVLAGTSLGQVAADAGVEPELVQRWVHLFVEGGKLRLDGRMDPSSYEARDRFLTLIAHEFRTPLAIIAGWVETLRAGDLPPQLTETALSAIARQVAYLQRIARDALDAGAVARGQLRLVVGRLDLRSLMAAVVDSMQDAACLDGDGPVSVVGDAARLEQVAAEVVAHARRLAGEGPVCITVRSDAVMATVEAAAAGSRLSFADAAVLFEPFERSDTSIGTGLGLFLCRALLSAHGGEIGVRSDDHATVFWFRVPVLGPSDGPLVERA
jgi:signal transduction histidine kinase